MKTSRIIMLLTLFTTIVSILIIINLNSDNIFCRIWSDIMGGTLIAFILELVNFIKEKRNNKNKIYYYISMNLIVIGVYNNTIKKLEDGTLSFSEALGVNEINQFVMYQNILNDIDDDYKMFNKEITNAKQQINNVLGKLKNQLLSFEMNLNEQKIINIQNNENKILKYSEVKKYVDKLSDSINIYKNNIDNIALKICSKKQLEQLKDVKQSIENLKLDN